MFAYRTPLLCHWFRTNGLVHTPEYNILTNRNMMFLSLRTNFSICILSIAGSSGSGGPAVGSGLTVPAFVELRQPTSHCNSMPVDPSADKMVGIMQNVIRNCAKVCIFMCACRWQILVFNLAWVFIFCNIYVLTMIQITLVC